MNSWLNNIKQKIVNRPMLQQLYMGLYKSICGDKYKQYIAEAESVIGDLAINPLDMVRETLLFGTFFDEYILYHFEQLNFEQRRAYLTDAVRNHICEQINDPKAQQILLNKYQTARYFKAYFKRETLLIKSHADIDLFVSFAKAYKEVVIKPLSECAGRGIQLYQYEENCEAFFKQLMSEGKSYIVEQRILQHPALAQWHPQSVNTIRVNTILKDNNFTIFNTFIRTGRGDNFVDNGAQGGLFASIDPTTGIIFTEGYDEKGGHFDCHPETKIPYIGTQIPYWEDLISLSSELAHAIPELVYVGWDLALTESGWVLVEGNKGQFVAQQLTQKKGLRKEFEDLVL